MSKGLKASSVKHFLITVVVLLFGAAAGGFYFGLQSIKEYAIQVNHDTIDADASAGKVDKLRNFKQYLAESETLVSKANQLFSTESDYQTRAVQDIQKYAGETGVSIANTSFNNAGGNAGQSGRTITISLESPVSYTSLLHFLDAIEDNVPKMQVAGISISRSDSGKADEVNIRDLIIMISTR